MAEVKHIFKAYGNNQVLADFSAVFPEGKITCVMAPSGKGKTTLLRILLGLEKPDKGQLSGFSKRKKSAVFQEDRLCENLSAGANVDLVRPGKKSRRTITGFFKKQEDKSAEHEWTAGFERLGLSDCINRPVRELSGGMRRRVALLRALYADWDILFLDEPFKGLDKDTKVRTIEFVKQQCRGRTVICVTHELKEAEMLGAGILVL